MKVEGMVSSVGRASCALCVDGDQSGRITVTHTSGVATSTVTPPPTHTPPILYLFFIQSEREPTATSCSKWLPVPGLGVSVTEAQSRRFVNFSPGVLFVVGFLTGSQMTFIAIYGQ